MTQVEAGIPGLAHAVRWNMRLACDTCVLSWFCDSKTSRNLFGAGMAAG